MGMRCVLTRPQRAGQDIGRDVFRDLPPQQRRPVMAQPITSLPARVDVVVVHSHQDKVTSLKTPQTGVTTDLRSIGGPRHSKQSLTRFLYSAYRDGGVVVAGTASELRPENPFPEWTDGAKVERRCGERGCGSSLYGFTINAANQRLAAGSFMPEPTIVTVDGVHYYAGPATDCPVRVSATLGIGWARDAIAVHYELHLLFPQNNTTYRRTPNGNVPTHTIWPLSGDPKSACHWRALGRHAGQFAKRPMAMRLGTHPRGGPAQR
jgi:hypothetical protein